MGELLIGLADPLLSTIGWRRTLRTRDRRTCPPGRTGGGHHLQPTPTAMASSPSGTSAAISLIAALTASGTTGTGDSTVVLVRAVLFW